VRIYSEVGEGTIVKIYLPRHLGPEVQAAEANRPSDPIHAIGAESILLVEDDDALRAYGVELLNELGYRVLAAANAAGALAIIDRGDKIDLLFTDVVMPGGMNGRELADEALRRRPGLKVLFTTGYTRNAIVHNGQLDPGIQLLGKPFTYSDLAAKIRSVLDDD
jgi:CheY-like chemotaxis protein